jgi:hypothetical protein
MTSPRETTVTHNSNSSRKNETINNKLFEKAKDSKPQLTKVAKETQKQSKGGDVPIKTPQSQENI